ncbi:MAG: phosphopentomutase [Oscillospiraceae bacterium]
MKRVFLIVLDSFGIGAAPDAFNFGDNACCNTLKTASNSQLFNTPNIKELGIFNIDDVSSTIQAIPYPKASFAKLQEASAGKDTIIGHWELAGVVSKSPLPVYPFGFPDEVISEFIQQTHHNILCNKPYSGTQVLLDYGPLHKQTGDLIVYTSADSVFQIAAHQDIIPLEKLYEYCEVARNILQGEHAVGRVIARPFVGQYPNYLRTPNRRDFSLMPPHKTMLNILKENQKEVIAIGKISDIFAHSGCTKSVKTKNNQDGMAKILEVADENFDGLCFLNLVDFDMLYGHRRNVDGYAQALTEFDEFLGIFLPKLNKDDILIITADHGCDPGCSTHTDHTREYVPMLIYGSSVKSGVNLHTRTSFADVGATILDYFAINSSEIQGTSFWNSINAF